MALLLFDVDGTMIRPLGLGRRAFERALRERYGEPPAASFSYDGMLDPQIAAQMLAQMGLDTRPAEVAALLDLYLRHLEGERPPQPGEYLCAGFPDLLDEARERGHLLALLTGNIREGARLKLAFFGLDRHFRASGNLLGAFGDDAEVRADLVPIAVARCAEAFGRGFVPSETWLIGDSPRDVEAAVTSGVRCAAVATGTSPLSALEALHPDAAFCDFRDAAPLWEALA